MDRGKERAGGFSCVPDQNRKMTMGIEPEQRNGNDHDHGKLTKATFFKFFFCFKFKHLMDTLFCWPGVSHSPKRDWQCISVRYLLQ